MDHIVAGHGVHRAGTRIAQAGLVGDISNDAIDLSIRHQKLEDLLFRADQRQKPLQPLLADEGATGVGHKGVALPCGK